MGKMIRDSARYDSDIVLSFIKQISQHRHDILSIYRTPAAGPIWHNGTSYVSTYLHGEFLSP